jgi:hypothetical protein
MVELELDAGAESDVCGFMPGNRPLYAAIASTEPRLASALVTARDDVRGWVGGSGMRSHESGKLVLDGEAEKHVTRARAELSRDHRDGLRRLVFRRIHRRPLR